MSAVDPLDAVAARALEMVRGDTVVGLGTGRAASAFVRALGERVRAGLRVRGVATSTATGDLAAAQGIPLVTLNDVDAIDLVVDGADEVDPALNCIKGYGGALVREKIVAAAARRFVILVGAEKLVPVLGTRGIVPVEVIPFALPLCRREIRKLGLTPQLRLHEGDAFITDNGNQVLDCGTGIIEDPRGLDRALRAIPGVVGTGIFAGMATAVLVGEPGGVRLLEHTPVC